jgi:hypothetical protein
MWQNQNHTLHHIHTEADTHLVTKLDHRIHKEFDLDIDGLAPIHPYMLWQTRLCRLLSLDNPEKSAWLVTIKTTGITWKRRIKQSPLQQKMLRESMQPPNAYTTSYMVIPILHLLAAPDCIHSRMTKSLLRAPIRGRLLRVIIELYIALVKVFFA